MHAELRNSAAQYSGSAHLFGLRRLSEGWVFKRSDILQGLYECTSINRTFLSMYHDWEDNLLNLQTNLLYTFFCFQVKIVVTGVIISQHKRFPNFFMCFSLCVNFKYSRRLNRLPCLGFSFVIGNQCLIGTSPASLNWVAYKKELHHVHLVKHYLY